jgi:rhodanese-related sulfurtransferase
MQNINREDLKHLLGREDLFLMDVRTSQAWEASNAKIEKAHRLDPDKLSQMARDIPKNKQLVIYCEDGQTRCPNFARELERMGFQKIAVLEGGFDGWVCQEFPTVPKDLR